MSVTCAACHKTFTRYASDPSFCKCCGVDLPASVVEQTDTEAEAWVGEDAISRIPLMTIHNPPEGRPYEVRGLVAAEAVLGMNMFRDLFAKVRDIVGGRSRASEKVLRGARDMCISDLQREASALGAHAIVGVSFSYNEFSGVGAMLIVAATGTAIKFAD